MSRGRRARAAAGAVCVALVLGACGAGPWSGRSAVTATAAPRPGVPGTGTHPAVHAVLGLGDSVTAGSACGCTDFVRLLSQSLAQRQGAPVSSVNRGASGQTTSQLLDRLRHDHDARADVRASDVVLVTTGANDLLPALRAWDTDGCDDACAARDVDVITGRVADVVAEVRALRAGRPTRVVVTTYWNVFEDGDVGRQDRGADYLRWSDQLTRTFNAALCPRVRAAGAACVDLYAPFKGAGDRDPTRLLADDGDHPDAAGHQLIADTLLAALDT